MSQPDELVLAAISGDVSALSKLLLLNATALRTRLRIEPRWQGTLDVDDVLQVTYLEAFLRISGFVPAGPGGFLAWLTRIADNNLRDAIRSLQRQKRPPPARQAKAVDGASVVELFELLGVTSATPSRALAMRESVEALDAALSRLPADYAKAVRAYDLEGRSIEATAALLGRSEGAVHMLRSRAHDRLRELLGMNPFLSVSE